MFELLLQYYKNWFSVYMAKELIDIDMEVISFEEIIEDYDSSLNKIGKFSGKISYHMKIHLVIIGTVNVGKAVFASHYLLWKKCVELNEPILILEHDVIFKENLLI